MGRGARQLALRVGYRNDRRSQVAVEPMIAFPDISLQTTGRRLELIAAVHHPEFGLVFDTGLSLDEGQENLARLFEEAYDHVI